MRNGAFRPVTHPLHAVTRVRHRAVEDAPTAAKPEQCNWNHGWTRINTDLECESEISVSISVHPWFSSAWIRLRRCAGGKPAAHPLHRYITYEKRGFSTRYIPVTCRYTGAAKGGGGRANGYHRPCAGGKPAAHPLHRYITYRLYRGEFCSAPFKGAAEHSAAIGRNRPRIDTATRVLYPPLK